MGKGATSPRLIAIFGSGETTSAMTSIHQELIRRTSSQRRHPILLDTPFGFQENADEIAGRAVEYFRHHVGTDIRVATLRGRADELAYERFKEELSQATYIFAGPGSPTYALRHWRDREIRGRLAEKLSRGGCIAFSSAAAAGLGTYAIPVYEIYKVGDDPFWVDGLDLLGDVGIRCAVVPHFNNSEGGTHDTRFCYVGENRLRSLEAMLPEDVAILGVDEHTACIIDIDEGMVTVRGQGGLTIRTRTEVRHWRRTTLPLSEIQAEPRPTSRPAANTSTVAQPETLDRNDAERVAATILQLESSLYSENNELTGISDAGGARSRMRYLVVRLAELARNGDDARQQLAPLVDLLLKLRNQARGDRRFEEADRVRSVLLQCGVELQDSPSGTAWSLARA